MRASRCTALPRTTFDLSFSALRMYCEYRCSLSGGRLPRASRRTAASGLFSAVDGRQDVHALEAAQHADQVVGVRGVAELQDAGDLLELPG